MQQKGKGNPILVAMILIGTLLVGCSEDAPTSSDDALVISISAFDQMIAEITPPVFDGSVNVADLAPVAPPDTSIGVWIDGEGALLRHGFGSQLPMALHRNALRLGNTVQWMNRVTGLGDTTFTGIPGDSGALSGTMTVTRLRQGVTVPSMCQSALAASTLPLQYHVRVQLNELTQNRLEAGIRQDDTCRILLAYCGAPAPDSAHPNAYEHSLTYAYHHRVRDTFTVRAVHVREYRNAEQECSMWTYEVSSRHQNQFFYRMTWLADDFADSSRRISFIGAGNRQLQFAIRYQQMIPAERPEPDTADQVGHVYRLFGPNYADQGMSLGATWEEATATTSMYQYSDLPVALRNAPAYAEASLNPWFSE